MALRDAFTVACARTRYRTVVILILGAPGESEYETALHLQRERWTTVVQRAGGRLTVIGGAPGPTEGAFDRVQRVLAEQTQASAGSSPLWVVLAGHGSFDGKEAKFNLRGPDFSGGSARNLA